MKSPDPSFYYFMNLQQEILHAEVGITDDEAGKICDDIATQKKIPVTCLKVIWLSDVSPKNSLRTGFVSGKG